MSEEEDDRVEGALQLAQDAIQRVASLEDTVESVRGQSVEVDEVVVVDDGSSDDTARVAQSLDVRLIRHDRNRGVSAARNSGVRAADNEWRLAVVPRALSVAPELVDGVEQGALRS
jgi:cellulose synthase/poly-beta-1,6-N-acetylglucosamine synthase-like glycosyltransferase